MNFFQEVLNTIINTLGTAYVMVILLRFFLQLVRANFRNPFFHTLMLLTNPLLMPLRKVIPGYGGIDLASLVLAVLIQGLMILALFLVVFGIVPNPAALLVHAFFGVARAAIWVFFLAMAVVVIASFISPQARFENPIVASLEAIIEPLARPFRRRIPPIGMLDLSYLFVSILLMITNNLLTRLMAWTSSHMGLY